MTPLPENVPGWLVDLLANHKAAMDNQQQTLVGCLASVMSLKYAVEVLIASHPEPEQALRLWLQQKDAEIERYVGGPSFAPWGADAFRKFFTSTWASLERSLHEACGADGSRPE